MTHTHACMHTQRSIVYSNREKMSNSICYVWLVGLFLKIYPVGVWLWEHCQKLNISIFTQYSEFDICFFSIDGKAFWWKFIGVFGMLNVCSITEPAHSLLRYNFHFSIISEFTDSLCFYIIFSFCSLFPAFFSRYSFLLKLLACNSRQIDSIL